VTAKVTELLGFECSQFRQVVLLPQGEFSVACCDNQMRVTFQRYVQGALFEDVLQAASLRLRRMSKGRFELQRGIRTGDGRQSGGLDINVRKEFRRRLSLVPGLRRPAKASS
jgi:hypothetical protein